MKPLFEQYRPVMWNEVIGQDKAVQKIQALTRRGLGGRAYWITGQSGTGKTTIARLLACEIADSFNIHELDASEATPARLREIEDDFSFYGFGVKPGKAVLINESHGLRKDTVRQLLVLLERLPLSHGTTVDVTLSKAGENIFKVFVFDVAGGPIALEQDKIVITRTAATVDAIPASHSIGIEVLEKLGGRPVLDYLVRAGDQLPKKGKKIYKAAESLKAGATGSLNIKLWEGEIEDPVTDNHSIGVVKISGSDFDGGVIHAGADLECDYEILDSGNIIIEVSVPCIGSTFHSGKNFYSRQEGQIDYTSASALVIEEGEQTLNRIDEINEVVDDPKLEQARQILESAISLDPETPETEKAQEAMENVHKARRILGQVRQEHIKEIRQIDLNRVVSFFNAHIRQLARPTEVTAFDNLIKTAQRSIDRNDKDFEHHLDELKGKNFEILWRQDWFVVERFKALVASPHLFTDKHRFEELAKIGTQYMRSDDIERLRKVVAELSMIQIGSGPDNETFDAANIIRG